MKHEIVRPLIQTKAVSLSIEGLALSYCNANFLFCFPRDAKAANETLNIWIWLASYVSWHNVFLQVDPSHSSFYYDFLSLPVNWWAHFQWVFFCFFFCFYLIFIGIDQECPWKKLKKQRLTTIKIKEYWIDLT